MRMKHRSKRKRLLAGLLALLLVLTGIPGYHMEVKAETHGDYSYEVNEDGESVTITRYRGSGGDITIPSEIGGKKVTSIGDWAFANCDSLSSVTIPEGVTNKANERLRRRFYKMTLNKGVNRNVATTAIARELACFVWGMMTEHIG